MLRWHACFAHAQQLQQQPADAPERGGGQRLQQQQRAQRVHPLRPARSTPLIPAHAQAYPNSCVVVSYNL